MISKTLIMTDTQQWNIGGNLYRRISLLEVSIHKLCGHDDPRVKTATKTDSISRSPSKCEMIALSISSIHTMITIAMAGRRTMELKLENMSNEIRSHGQERLTLIDPNPINSHMSIKQGRYIGVC